MEGDSIDFSVSLRSVRGAMVRFLKRTGRATGGIWRSCYGFYGRTVRRKVQVGIHTAIGRFVWSLSFVG
jgi:hypothetical protein